MERQEEISIQLNLTQEELDANFNGFEQNQTGSLHEIVAKLLKVIGGVEKILIAGDFRSANDQNEVALSCSVKANPGFLYPLKSSLIFITKPIIYTSHREIKYVEF